MIDSWLKALSMQIQSPSLKKAHPELAAKVGSEVNNYSIATTTIKRLNQCFENERNISNVF